MTTIAATNSSYAQTQPYPASITLRIHHRSLVMLLYSVFKIRSNVDIVQ